LRAADAIFALGTIAALLLVIASCWHVYWALGGRAGRALAIPEREGRPLFNPRPSGTLLVAGLLFLAALTVAIRIGLLPIVAPPALITTGCWGLALVFAGRAIGDFRYVGFFKRVRETRFAKLDGALYAPLCAFLGLAAALAAL
jgi:hypothetical protein